MTAAGAAAGGTSNGRFGCCTRLGTGAGAGFGAGAGRGRFFGGACERASLHSLAMGSAAWVSGSLRCGRGSAPATFAATGLLLLP